MDEIVILDDGPDMTSDAISQLARLSVSLPAELLAQLDASPVSGADGRLGNQVVMTSATIAALYSPSDWPVLGGALADAAQGDPSGLFRLADDYS